MSLLLEYTLSLLENDKVVVDFADTSPSGYELREMLRFFRKYKKEVFIDFEGERVFYIVLPWMHWVEFLIDMGFQDTAKACCEVLNDLEVKNAVTMEEYVIQLKQAKIIKEYKTEPTMERDIETFEELKQFEVDRLVKEQRLLTFTPKSSSELTFEKELPRLMQQYEGFFVAYIDGELVGFDEERDVLIEKVMYEKHREPDFVKKIEEIEEKEQEEN